MKLHQLELLCALEQYHSFSKTAQHLFLSQPALSLSLKALEKELQYTLLERSTHGVQFTPAGKLALEKAHAIANEIMLIRSIAESSTDITQHMSIASNTLTCIDLLAHVYYQLSQNHPQLSFNLQETDEQTLFHQILYGNLDFGLLQINAIDIAAEQAKLNQQYSLSFLELKREPLTIMVSKNHLLAEKNCISVTELFPYRFFTAHTETDRHLIAALHALGYQHTPMLLQDSACLNQLISNSNYWAFVSQSEILRHHANHSDDFAFLELKDFPCYCVILWVHAHEKHSPEEPLLLNTIRSLLNTREERV